MIKSTKRGVYATPDFEIEVIQTEAGFAVSLETENFGSYDEETL